MAGAMSHDKKAKNSLDFQELLNDLQEWEQSIKEKDKKLRTETQGEREAALKEIDELDTKQVPNTSAQRGPKLLDAKEKKITSKSTTKQNMLDDVSFNNFLGNSGNFDASSIFGHPKDDASEALSEKEQGNEYFKEKRYSEAIDCYSRSILLYPTAVAFANRAMAYIKTGRYEEAEYDCSEAINLDDRYVKAYSRRGTARKELGRLLDALEDFEFALRLEPGNKELQKQYQESRIMYEKRVFKKIPEKKNPIQIEEIRRDSTMMDTEEASKTSTSLREAVNSQSISTIRSDSATSDTAQNLVLEQRQREMGTKQIADGNRNKDSLVLSDSVAERAASRVASAIARKLTAPKTAYEFEALWKGFQGEHSAQIELIKVMDPTSLPKVFKEALSAPLLLDIIRCIKHIFIENMNSGIQYLESLTKVARFDMTIMCLSSKDKAELQKLWDEVFIADKAPICFQETLKRLHGKYCRR
eukprot:TRINITY_DN5681_c0_g1_i3.p1 TRINITY_DN5681_c0_g1~~TRINITY_DN5681_c0_g1_i3.p1  ORF type:complete len:472 (+),score=127.61 TRINITY_DN5681_c0_g1_i3:280-1695(+)